MHVEIVRTELVDGYVRTTYIDDHGTTYVTESLVVETRMKPVICNSGTKGCGRRGKDHVCVGLINQTG